MMLKFIGYKNGGTIKPLCIILADLLNILKTTKKVKTFLAGDDDVILKYNKIWKKLKRLLSAEFDSHPVYDEKCIKTRVKIYEGKIITKFTDNEIKEEISHYSCIAAIYVDSVIKLEKENYPQVSLEQCKFRLKN